MRLLATAGSTLVLCLVASGALARDAGPSRGEAERLVAAWLQAQNDHVYADYARLYAPVFGGIKRTTDGREFHKDRAAWLNDRKGMIRPGLQVRITGLEVTPVDGRDWSRVVARFRQYWKSEHYADQGEKTLALEWTPGGYRIRGEELHDSQDWDGRTFATPAAAAPRPVSRPASSPAPAPVRPGSRNALWESPGFWAVAGLLTVVGWGVYEGFKHGARGLSEGGASGDDGSSAPRGGGAAAGGGGARGSSRAPAVRPWENVTVTQRVDEGRYVRYYLRCGDGRKAIVKYAREIGKYAVAGLGFENYHHTDLSSAQTAACR